MKWEVAQRGLTQDGTVCIICFASGKRYSPTPVGSTPINGVVIDRSILIGGSAVLGAKTSVDTHERAHGKGSYKRAVARRLEEHLKEKHPGHPFAQVLLGRQS